MPGAVGVVAVQGDFQKHVEAFVRCGVPLERVRHLRSPEDLEGVERVVLPGGESTTVGLLMRRFGLDVALIEAAKRGIPVWGTCMGMILMAREIVGYPHQYCLDLLDVAVRRNAFGAQVHSFEAPVKVSFLQEPLLGVFIRAPVVESVGPGVEAICEFEGKIVGVKQRKMIGTSFHPELTEDVRFHRWFLAL